MNDDKDSGTALAERDEVQEMIRKAVLEFVAQTGRRVESITLAKTERVGQIAVETRVEVR